MKLSNRIKGYLVLSIILFSQLSIAGGGDAAGGYEFRDTSWRTLEMRSRLVSRVLSSIPQNEFNDLVSKFSDKIVDQSEFGQIIKNVQKAPTENRAKTDSNGFTGNLNMDYSAPNRSIVALRPFFVKYDVPSSRLSKDDIDAIDRQLMHEATHVFGIGIENDNDSYALSLALLDRIRQPINEKYRQFGCGANGNIAQRVSDCDFSAGGFAVIQIGAIEGVPRDHKYKTSVTFTALDTLNKLQFYTAVMTSPYSNTFSTNAATYCRQIGSEWRIPSISEAKEILRQNFLEPGTKFVAHSTTGNRVYVDINGKVRKTVDSWIGGPKYYEVVCVSKTAAN